MKRADPVELRKAMKLARDLARLGVLFTPMPVLDPLDLQRTVEESKARLQTIIERGSSVE